MTTEREMSTPPVPLWGMALFTFIYLSSYVVSRAMFLAKNGSAVVLFVYVNCCKLTVRNFIASALRRSIELIFFIFRILGYFTNWAITNTSTAVPDVQALDKI